MEYDWDSVQCGRPELNSSQNFFRVRHVLHEKEGAKLKDIQVLKENQIAPVKKITEKVTNEAQSKQQIQPQGKENVSSNRAILAVSMVQKPLAAASSKPSMLKSMLKKSVSVPPPASAPVAPKKPEKPNQPPAIKKVPKDIAIGQRQFDYAKIQEKRKEMLAQKIKEEEEKQLKFNFHANPAPKFRKIQTLTKQPSFNHRKLTKQTSLPQIPLMNRKTTKENIVPSCGDPERLKYLNEKKKSLAQKWQEPLVQFKAKPAAVLKKQPFQPVHNTAKTIDSKPFKLQLTERLLQRSEFDKKLHETIAIRKKQEEILQQLHDNEDRKLLRQKTEFRARANPFRNYH